MSETKNRFTLSSMVAGRHPGLLNSYHPRHGLRRGHKPMVKICLWQILRNVGPSGRPGMGAPRIAPRPLVRPYGISPEIRYNAVTVGVDRRDRPAAGPLGDLATDVPHGPSLRITGLTTHRGVP